MKRYILLICLPLFMCAADNTQNRVPNLLAQNSNATELDWSNQNLTNQDFTNLTIEASHVKKLDLSNNSFVGKFPLSTVLRAYTNLETLKLNNNTQLTEFELEDDFTNNKLKTLEAENTGFETVDLNALRPKIRLDILDLSRCKQLKKFIMFGYMPHTDSDHCINVHMRDVVMPEVHLKKYKEAGIFESSRAASIRSACSMLSLILACSGGMLACNYAQGHCVTSPIALPENDRSVATGISLANAGIWLAPPAFAAGAFGFKCIGGAIAYCLPNHGKVTAIKFITNSTENV